MYVCVCVFVFFFHNGSLFDSYASLLDHCSSLPSVVCERVSWAVCLRAVCEFVLIFCTTIESHANAHYSWL